MSDDLILGRHFDEKTGKIGGRIPYSGERHVFLFGPNGTGKGTRFLVQNLLSDAAVSTVVIDPKGELCAITSAYRRLLGDVLILNPFNVLGLGSDGFNPLTALNPDSPNFYDDAAALGEALIKIEGNDPHWGESAQGLLVALIMWEAIKNRAGVPNLENVRRMLTEPERYETFKGEDGKKRERLAAGLSVTAADMIAEGRYEMTSLAGRFTGQTGELASIRSTTDTQTRWILSEPMRADLRKPGVRFEQLKEKPTTVYVILPAERIRTHSVWLRLVITSVLRALYRPGGVRTRLFVDEMPALGHLGPLEDAIGLVRGYRTQIIGISQDVGQLKALYRDRWESFIANAGVVQFFAPNDLTTAEWVSRRAGKTTVLAPSTSERHSGQGVDQGESMSWGQVGRPLYLPQELMGMSEGSGLLFLAGMSNATRFFAPSYWKIEQAAARAEPNPYFTS